MLKGKSWKLSKILMRMNSVRIHLTVDAEFVSLIQKTNQDSIPEMIIQKYDSTKGWGPHVWVSQQAVFYLRNILEILAMKLAILTFTKKKQVKVMYHLTL